MIRADSLRRRHLFGRMAEGTRDSPARRQAPSLAHCRGSSMRQTASRLRCGASVYPEADLERLEVRVRFRQQALEARVLGLELLQALGVLCLHAAVLGAPG